MASSEWLPRAALRELCVRAGEAILAVRAGGDWAAREKADASPVTAADQAAHDVLMAGLAALTPEVPVLSEEAVVPWTTRRHWTRYWLVDPLDGTREFIDGFDDFTVNLALVEAGRTRYGLVHAPVTGTTWEGGSALGAWRWQGDRAEAITVASRWPPRVVASRAHLDERTRAWLAGFPEASLLRYGSSVKFCRIAEGEADLYPRFAPTSEWDTAAAQAVLEGAGGAVLVADTLLPLTYNGGESLRNPAFVACAEAQGRWRKGTS
ncbi:3'(2'),5'-bisphosphate nucleotidase CysQ [Bisbaumannia pacifica]|uniref:3'(2'),5'-bisphosphate nucleotidase CysQ n=1 Tax=Bisbaumannia pacifica TaxID=77098 RepID=A0A510X3H4_9GAMM|nr:3'(2'),5'-bisphosphate nucleotidase CysQ [Halomonas pacifica]GEK45962.1 3'(2'),5'-bisphosphate nucleotidase CysQ [Halomonas pacifica]